MMKFNFEKNITKDEDDVVEKFPKVEFRDGSFFDQLPEETQEEYLSRTMKKVVETYKEDEERFNLLKRKSTYYGRHAHFSMSEFFSDPINTRKLKNKLIELKENDDIKFSENKNKKIFTELDNSIVVASREIIEEGENGMMDYYDKTNQRRDFFISNRGKDAHSYSAMMFGLPENFTNTKEGKEYIRDLIDNKTIFLFGGGDSIRDLLKSDEFKPKKVINFDPFIKEEDINKNLNGVYESQMISASDKKIGKMIENNLLPRADEVWATYSVPFYLDSSQDIKDLIKNMSMVLNEGGSARFYPISVQSKEQSGETFETRKKALLDSIKNLLDSSDYNISIFNNTLKIHKIKKETKQ